VLRVTLLAPRIVMWLLDFWKICGSPRLCISCEFTKIANDGFLDYLMMMCDSERYVTLHKMGQ